MERLPERRSVLAGVASAAGIALAGCASPDDGGGSGEEEAEGESETAEGASGGDDDAAGTGTGTDGIDEEGTETEAVGGTESESG